MSVDLTIDMLASNIPEGLGLFDRFAATVTRLVSRAPFFVGCVVLVLVWAPSILILQDIEVWQLIINTVTTIVTFLLVALLQNSQHRADLALQHKLNSIADALAELMRDHGEERGANELDAAIGLEDRESSKEEAISDET